MINLRFSRRHILVVASCIALPAGCSLLPAAPQAQIYRLSPPTDDPPHRPRLNTRLVVDEPTASESLDTDRIALTRDRIRFNYYANSVWTDRVPVLVQTLLIDAFENSGGIAEIGRDASVLTPDYLLETEIRDFQARYESPSEHPPDVVVSLDLSLVRMPDHQIAGQALVTETSPAARNDLSSIVEAFDAVVDRVLVRSVAWTLSAMRPIRHRPRSL